jgi:uncharacterized protein YdcH (DUF465 family)
MFGEKHDLNHEFPEYRDKIHELKMNNGRFSRLFDEYADLDKQVRHIEEGIENTDDLYLEQLKKQRLNHKDLLYAMLVE